jgi:hypothetical protein
LQDDARNLSPLAFLRQQEVQEKQESTSTDEETPFQHRSNTLQDDARNLSPLAFLRQQVAEMREPKTTGDLPIRYIPAGSENSSSSVFPASQKQEELRTPKQNIDFMERDAQGREMYSLSSDEDSGRVRFVSARIPATGSGVPYLSMEQETAKLKSILKPSRAAGQYSSSSSDQECVMGRNRLMEQQGGEHQGLETSRTRMNMNVSMQYPGKTMAISPGAQETSTRTASEMAQPLPPQMLSQNVSQVPIRLSREMAVQGSSKPSPRLPSAQDSFKLSARLPSDVLVQGSSKTSPRLPSDLVSHSSPLSCDSESNLEDGVLIHGEGVPRPFMSIDTCPLYEFGSRLDIQCPTPLQRHMWPALLRGRDVAGIAPKNAGKKLAYLLPIVDQVMDPGAYSELPLTNGVSMLEYSVEST